MPDSQLTIDSAITTEILSRNLRLVMHALDDARSRREEQGDEDSAEVYARLLDELEEFQDAE